MIGWIDGGAGASGDMLLGAIVGAGVPLETLQREIDRFELGIVLRTEAVQRGGLAATKVDVDVPETATLRHLADIVELLEVLPESIRVRAVSTLRRLADAEAEVHGTSIDDVHFHEVGALDSIADVVGVCTGFVALGLDALHSSTLSLGSGQTRGAHGPIPIPVPAVVALLSGVAPVQAGPAPFESTTPTGAALLAEWVDAWGELPPMEITTAAAGAGSNDADQVVNATRLLLGEPGAAARVRAGGVQRDTTVQLDTNVDDLDPRLWPRVIAAAMEAGALDAWLTPILMKKGRPAHTLSVLCRPDRVDGLRRLIFEQTSTIGIREHVVDRHMLERRLESVEVEGHRIAVKVAMLGGKVVNRSAEWDDVAAAAAALGRPPAEVLAAATSQMR